MNGWVIFFTITSMICFLLAGVGLGFDDRGENILGVFVCIVFGWMLSGLSFFEFSNNYTNYSLDYHNRMTKALSEVTKIESESGVRLDNKSKDNIIDKYFEEDK